MAAELITMHEDGIGAALGIVGVAVPSNEHCETMRRSEITVVTRGPFRWVVGERSRAPPPLIFQGGIYGCWAAHHT